MKLIWKIIIISVASGLILSITGYSMGASRKGVYLDKTGVQLIGYNDGNSETKITELDLESFKNIDVDAGFCNVELIDSDKYGIDIHAYSGQWAWEIKNDTLRVSRMDKQRLEVSFFVYESGPIQKGNINIYLPLKEGYKTVSIKADSGNVNIGGLTADDVEIKNSFGKAELREITSDNLNIDLASVGFAGSDLNAQNIICKNNFGKAIFKDIEAETFIADVDSCDFELTGCTAGSIDVSNNFGKIDFKDINTGTLNADADSCNLTLMDSNAGSIDINNSFGKIKANSIISSKTNIKADSVDVYLNGDFSGETTVSTSFGDIELTTSNKKEYYSYDVSVSFGKITFDKDTIESDSIRSNTTTENMLKLEASSGNIEVYFAQ